MIESLGTARERSPVIKDDYANQPPVTTIRTLYVPVDQISGISAVGRPDRTARRQCGVMSRVGNTNAFWILAPAMALIVAAEVTVRDGFDGNQVHNLARSKGTPSNGTNVTSRSSFAVNTSTQRPSISSNEYSRAKLPLIPGEGCHPFHGKVATYSKAKLPP